MDKLKRILADGAQGRKAASAACCGKKRAKPHRIIIYQYTETKLRSKKSRPHAAMVLYFRTTTRTPAHPQAQTPRNPTHFYFAAAKL
ncbi:hypothetical protein [Conchiformibius kuhniae]|uniref:Uncharacterized protein n=1 Tax=Conchiformibius kuhniae TaxID=211502 RepID=A0ABD8B6S5_9NEIS|nr:hypothetical protein [Conchiformibius kuhniae]